MNTEVYREESYMNKHTCPVSSKLRLPRNILVCFVKQFA